MESDSIGLLLALAAGLLIAVILLAALAWRRASAKTAQPCPVWMIPLLENPYVRALAGAETLIARAAVSPSMRVLDVGCGPGRLTIPLARTVGPEGRVVALDLQPAMLERLRRRVEAHGLVNVGILCAAAGDGSLEATAFDRAFLVTVLGEIVEQGAALEEIYSRLAPGGMLSITEVFPDPHYQGRGTVRQVVQEAGFELADEFGSWVAFTLNCTKPDRSQR